MKKKQTRHFVPDKDRLGNGVPACHCFDHSLVKNMPALAYIGEVARTRKQVTCGNCKRTKLFRKVR